MADEISSTHSTEQHAHVSRPSGGHSGSSSHSGPGAGPRTPRPAGAPTGGPGGRKFFRRKKVCKFCTEKIAAVCGGLTGYERLAEAIARQEIGELQWKSF